MCAQNCIYKLYMYTSSYILYNFLDVEELQYHMSVAAIDMITKIKQILYFGRISSVQAVKPLLERGWGITSYLHKNTCLKKN